MGRSMKFFSQIAVFVALFTVGPGWAGEPEAAASRWKSLSAEEQMKYIEWQSNLGPLNWGTGSGGIDYGGGGRKDSHRSDKRQEYDYSTVRQKRHRENEEQPSRRSQDDLKSYQHQRPEMPKRPPPRPRAEFSSGNCLGIACYRNEQLIDALLKKEPRSMNKKEIEAFHAYLGDMDARHEEIWQKSRERAVGYRSQDPQQENAFGSLQEMVALAKRNPGIDIGVQVGDQHHALQIFAVSNEGGESLYVVDPNIGDVMMGSFDEKTRRFSWRTQDGASSATADFAYPPARVWPK